MTVSSVSALWNDQTASVVSALKNSNDATISSFSKMLDDMMSNNSAQAKASSSAGTSAAARLPAVKLAALRPLTSADTASAAKGASSKWISKMADHFSQTAQAGSVSTLLPDINATSQPQTWAA